MYSTDPKSHKNNANINTDDEFSPHPQHLFTPVDHAHNNLNKSSSSNYYQEEDETDTLKNERMDCSNSSSFFETYISNNLLILGLISIKLLTQHITGFLVIIGCIATAFTANNRVKLFDRRCVNGRGSIQIEAIGVIVALGVNQYLLYKVIMAEDGAANVLVLQPVSGIFSANIVMIFWLILVSQFFMVLVEISLKALLSLMSIPFNRRGYSYSLIKNCLTLYRWILPMPQICAYLWSSSQSLTKHSTNPDPNIPDEEIMVNSAHTWFSSLFDILLIITYVVFKGFGIREYAVNLYKSFILLLSPFKIGEYVGEHAILESKICPISHLPFSTERYGERPMNITNASNVTNTVSEQGLYCWLNLQSEMDLSHLMPPESLNSTSSRSKKEVGFLCPLTLEPLRVGNLNITEAKSYLSSSATSHHVFLM